MRDRFKSQLRASVMLLAAAVVCFVPAHGAPADQEGSFTGTWTATGHWQPLEFKADREVFTYKLSGHVNLKNDIGELKDFWSECVGLWDSGKGSTARCVWRDPGGAEAAFVVLEGQLITEGVKVNGEFVGGTGALEGLTGSVSFTWTSVFRNRTEHMLTGHTKDISGIFRIATGN